MSEVHKAITAHSQNQNKIVAAFLKLEQQREYFIDAAVKLCMENKDFSVDYINQVTKEMNDLARNGIAPQRKIVSKEMVQEYANRLKLSK